MLCQFLQDKDSYLLELEGLVKDYEALATEKGTLEQQGAEHESRHTQLRRELEEAQSYVEQHQQVSVFLHSPSAVTVPAEESSSIRISSQQSRV